MSSWFSKKEKERVYTGFMGDTSPEQDLILKQFREWVKQENYDKIGRFDDYDLLRFCRARKFEMEKMKTMFQNFINWRRENDIDNVLWDFHFTES